MTDDGKLFPGWDGIPAHHPFGTGRACPTVKRVVRGKAPGRLNGRFLHIYQLLTHLSPKSGVMCLLFSCFTGFRPVGPGLLANSETGRRKEAYTGCIPQGVPLLGGIYQGVPLSGGIYQGVPLSGCISQVYTSGCIPRGVPSQVYFRVCTTVVYPGCGKMCTTVGIPRV